MPTTYSGSEATPIWGMSDGERKFTGKDNQVLPRTIVYDPDLTLGLPPAVSAASGMNALAHCVEGLWVADRTPFLVALATDAARRFAGHLPRVVADGSDREARGECLVAAWLAGIVLAPGHGAAAQARARAGRPRPAARREPRDHPAARHALQSRGGAARRVRGLPPRSARTIRRTGWPRC